MTTSTVKGVAMFYVRKDGIISGPFEAAAIKKLAATGKISANDELSPDGNKWKPAGSAKGLTFVAVAAEPKPKPTRPPRTTKVSSGNSKSTVIIGAVAVSAILLVATGLGAKFYIDSLPKPSAATVAEPALPKAVAQPEVAPIAAAPAVAPTEVVPVENPVASKEKLAAEAKEMDGRIAIVHVEIFDLFDEKTLLLNTLEKGKINEETYQAKMLDLDQKHLKALKRIVLLMESRIEKYGESPDESGANRKMITNFNSLIEQLTAR